MDGETPAYLNQLKQLAFRHGLVAAHAVDPSGLRLARPEERQEAVDHTKKCIALAARLGIPAVRLNSGRWNTIKSFDDLMKVKGDEPPIQGYTTRTRSSGASRASRPACPMPKPPASCSRSRTTGA